MPWRREEEIARVLRLGLLVDEGERSRRLLSGGKEVCECLPIHLTSASPVVEVCAACIVHRGLLCGRERLPGHRLMRVGSSHPETPATRSWHPTTPGRILNGRCRRRTWRS